jgi:integrase
MAALSHAFTIAVKEWQWVDDNPFRRVSKPREPRGRERFLSDDERDLLMKASKASTHPWLYPVVILAVSTGMRRGEILSLRWPQVDLKARRILLHDTKNGSSRSVPLRGLALTVIAELSKVRRIDTDLLFSGTDPSKPFALDNHWRAVAKAAKLKDFRFHDLRHTAASYLAMNGASTIEIASVLGHKTLQMVQRYSHLTASHTEAVVEAMNERIFAGTDHGRS